MRTILIALIPVVVTTTPLHAPKTQDPRITGLYTNMRMSSETGDLAGESLYITSSRAGFYAVFQMAEGSADIPVLVPLEVQGATVKFEFPAASKYARGLRSFEGTVTPNGLSGRFANGYEIKLARLPC